MDITTAFPSSYLKASDLQGRRVLVTMAHVKLEDIADESKPVLYFAGKEKGMVLNKTNANMIIEIVGSSDTEHWKGKQVVLYVAKVDFQGRRVDAVRVDYPVEKPTAPPPTVETDPIPF